MGIGQDRGFSRGHDPTGLFVIDDQQRLVEWSDAAAALLAIPAEQAVGRPCYEVIHGCDPLGRPACPSQCAALRALRRGRLTGSSSLIVRRQALTPLRLRCELSALPGAPGGAIGHLSLSDQGSANSRERSQPQIRSGSQDIVSDLAALALLTTSLSAKTLEQSLDQVLDILREATRAESAELFVAEPTGQDLLLIAYRGPFHTAFFQRVRFRMGEGFPGLATSCQEPVLTNALPNDPRYLRPRVVEKGYRSYVCVPLLDAEGVLGAVCVGSRHLDLDCAQAERLLTWAAAPITAALRAGMLRARQLVSRDAIMPGVDGDHVFDQLLRAVLRDICRLGQADGGTIVVLSTATGGLVRRVSEGVFDGEVCSWHERLVAAGCCPALAANCGIVLSGLRSGWPLACQRRHRCGAVTYCVPMRVGDEVVGTIDLIYRHAGPSPPTRYLPMVHEMAAQAASLVKHARDTFEQHRRIEATYRQSAMDDAGEAASRHLHDSRGQVTEPFLRIRCLGAFELYRQGVLVTPQMFKRRKALTLLKILLLHAGRPVPRDTLIEALWPESDPHKTASRLYVVVHALREILEPDGAGGGPALIRTDGDRYVFAADGRCWLDLSEYRGAILRGQQAEAAGDQATARAAYSAAAHLYRGDLLEDEPFAEWCWLEREHLRETNLSALQRLAGLLRDTGDLGRAIGAYRRALRVDPLREAIQRQLIECLWSAGRRDEALRQYELLRTLLRRELDITPLPETEELIGRLRAELAASTRTPHSADSV